MTPLEKFLDRQKFRTGQDAEFFSRLDPARTSFLCDMFGEALDSMSLGRIGVPWLDLERFRARIAAACAWLEGVHLTSGGKGWDGAWLFFFQMGSFQEDAAAHELRLKRDLEVPPIMRLYTERWGTRPLGLRYLHTYSNYAGALAGSYAEGNLRVCPLFSGFNVPEPNWILDGACVSHWLERRTLGYLMTDYPQLLGVSSRVATDYLARIVVHDLCHGFLPNTPRAVEGFHNAAALTAMGELPAISYASAWERLIHAECTVPAFCLQASEEIVEVRRALNAPSPVQADVLRAYSNWYASPAAARKRAERWGLSPKAGPDDLLAAIECARQDGFQIYQRNADRISHPT